MHQSGPKEVKAGQQVPLAHGCCELSHLQSKALLTGGILSLLKQMWEGYKRSSPTQMYRYHLKDVRIKDDQRNMTQPPPKTLIKLQFGCVCLVTQLSLALCDLIDSSPPGSSAHGIFSGKNDGVSCSHFPLPGHLLNPGVEAISAVSPTLQADSLPSHQGNPKSPIIDLKTWKSMKCLMKN